MEKKHSNRFVHRAASEKDIGLLVYKAIESDRLLPVLDEFDIISPPTIDNFIQPRVPTGMGLPYFKGALRAVSLYQKPMVVGIFGVYGRRKKSRKASMFATLIDETQSEYYDDALEYFITWVFNELDVRKLSIRLFSDDNMIKALEKLGFEKHYEKKDIKRNGVYVDVIVMSKINSS